MGEEGLASYDKLCVVSQDEAVRRCKALRYLLLAALSLIFRFLAVLRLCVSLLTTKQGWPLRRISSSVNASHGGEKESEISTTTAAAATTKQRNEREGE